jgi:hypothetical protein
MVAIDTLVVAIGDPISCLTGSTSIIIEGFKMTFGLFNFHVDDYGTVELISTIDRTTSAADLVIPLTEVTQLMVENTPSSTPLPTSAKADPILESSSPSVGSNNFQDSPPSPIAAYCIDCDTYHFVGDGDFSLHKIAGCEDPRGGTAVVYPTISECERVLNALMLQPAPYDPDYVEGLYSYYTCLDDEFYPEAKGNIGNLVNSHLCKSAISSSGYVVDYDSDTMIEVGTFIGDDDIYPLA